MMSPSGRRTISGASSLHGVVAAVHAQRELQSRMQLVHIKR